MPGGYNTRGGSHPARILRVCSERNLMVADPSSDGLSPLEPDEFGELVRRLRTGDAAAAEQLVRQYEAIIRLEVRSHLGDRRLPAPLTRWTCARRCWAASSCVRPPASTTSSGPRTSCDCSRGWPATSCCTRCGRNSRGAAMFAVWSPCPTRASVRARSRLPAGWWRGAISWRPCAARLSPEERQLADRRAQGQEWGPIAAELGGTPSGRRKQLGRALDRVAQELGLDDLDHD